MRSGLPIAMRSGASGSPSKHAVVGQVSTVCPMRSISRFGSASESIVNSSTLMPGRPSGVSVGRELALDRRLALAGDDGGGEAGELVRGLARPLLILRRDDDARAAHPERLGERVVDLHAADLHQRAPVATGVSRSPVTG